MAYWLYQMSADNWEQERYRAEVWEGQETTWNVNKVTPVGHSPKAGETVVLYYAPTGAKDPGILGWAVILWSNEDEIRFRPASPSDYLKMNPLWNDEIINIITDICGKMRRGTMWEVSKDQMKRLRKQISESVPDHRSED